MAVPTPNPARAGIATCLVLGVVLGGAAGLARYLDGHQQQVDALTALGESAEQLANDVLRNGPASISQPDSVVGAVTVVLPGRPDAFGIVRGAKLALNRNFDDAFAPAQPQAFEKAILDRSASMGAIGKDGAEPMPRALRYEIYALNGDKDAMAFAAYAPIRGDAAYGGMVRVARRAPTPKDPIPIWLWALSVLGSALFAAFFYKVAFPRRQGLMGLVGGAAGPGAVSGASGPPP